VTGRDAAAGAAHEPTGQEAPDREGHGQAVAAGGAASPSPSTDTDERLARAALSSLVGFGDARVAAAVRTHGPVEAWDRLRHRHPDVEPRRDLDRLREVGGRLVCPGEPGWPIVLDALDRPGGSAGDVEPGAPLALWLRGPGDLGQLTERAVAVVGSRAATDYGRHLAGELAYALAERGWTIVSGAAFGIDAAAHRGALAGAGPTVAVLAGGVDVPYPAAHADLLDGIRDAGLLVSEVPPGAAALRRRFLIRNRIIAALARATVLVEAGHRSGALSTARHARRLGRALLVVPGPVTSAMSAGCHRVLRDHRECAALVTSADEIEEEIGPVGSLAPEPRALPHARDDLPRIVRELLEAMPTRGGVGVAVLASRIGQHPQTVLAMLGPLAVEGLVESTPGGYRLTRLGRVPARPGPRRGSGPPPDPAPGTSAAGPSDAAAEAACAPSRSRSPGPADPTPTLFPSEEGRS
jgi:DNA processing protein